MRKIVCHWFPNDDEIYLQDDSSLNVVGGAAPNISGFKWIAYASGAANTSYNFDIGVTIEYVPTDATRNLVNKTVSIVHPLAEYYLNMLVATRWKPLVISELAEWRRVVQDRRTRLQPIRTGDQFAAANGDVRATYAKARTIQMSDWDTMADA